MSIRHAEIFKVNDRVGKEIAAIPDEPIDKVVVVTSSQPSSFPAHVKGIREECVVISSNVQNDREDSIRIDACAEGVQC